MRAAQAWWTRGAATLIALAVAVPWLTANAGTTLMLVDTVHAVVGNVLIGAIEGLALILVARWRVRVALPMAIAANLASWWLFREVILWRWVEWRSVRGGPWPDHEPDRTFSGLYALHVELILLTIVVTLAVEVLFLAAGHWLQRPGGWCCRPAPDVPSAGGPPLSPRRWRTVLTFLGINAVTMGAVFVAYRWAHDSVWFDFRMSRQALAATPPGWLYFIDDDGGLHRIRLDGTGAEDLRQLPSPWPGADTLSPSSSDAYSLVAWPDTGSATPRLLLVPAHGDDTIRSDLVQPYLADASIYPQPLTGRVGRIVRWPDALGDGVRLDRVDLRDPPGQWSQPIGPFSLGDSQPGAADLWVWDVQPERIITLPGDTLVVTYRHEIVVFDLRARRVAVLVNEGWSPVVVLDPPTGPPPR